MGNALCELLRIEVPVIAGPLGSASSPELVAAVGEAGALGMLAFTWVSDAQARDQVHRVRRASGRPFGVNLVLDFPVDSKVELCLTESVPVISTVWGDPGPINEHLRGSGIRHLHTVGSVDEARRAVDAGVDAVVAQGWEAGGHVRRSISTMALVPAVVDAVGSVPVIAAGGVADGRGLAAVLALGAQAAWMGTRFVTATEASAGDEVVRRVLEAGAEEELLALPGLTGDHDYLVMHAGQAVGLVHDTDAAGAIVRSVVSDAVKVIERMHPRY